jgi:hypothetical protein
MCYLVPRPQCLNCLLLLVCVSSGTAQSTLPDRSSQRPQKEVTCPPDAGIRGGSTPQATCACFRPTRISNLSGQAGAPAGLSIKEPIAALNEVIVTGSNVEAVNSGPTGLDCTGMDRSTPMRFYGEPKGVASGCQSQAFRLIECAGFIGRADRAGLVSPGYSFCVRRLTSSSGADVFVSPGSSSGKPDWPG